MPEQLLVWTIQMMQCLLDFNQTGMLLSKPKGNVYLLQGGERKNIDNFVCFYTFKTILKMVTQ